MRGIFIAATSTMAVILFGAPAAAVAQEFKPVPRMQAVPMPYDQVSFQRDGTEITRYHFGAALKRPFVFPVIGPSGRPLTRMGHPHDPVGHIHHNSVWVSHNDVGGVNFWADHGKDAKGRVVHQRIEQLFDHDDFAAVLAVHHWVDESARKMLLTERRRIEIRPLDKGEYWLIIDMLFESPGPEIAFGKSSFGLVAVRMAKTIGVHDGGGIMRNSEAGVNEKAIFWKPTKWVDYSGPVANRVIEGITLMDHPTNPQHPSPYHVRDDGWMGASLSFHEPVTVSKARPLRLRYGLYVHAGVPSVGDLNARWHEFSKLPLAEMFKKR